LRFRDVFACRARRAVHLAFLGATDPRGHIEPQEATEALRKAGLEQEVAAVIAPRRLVRTLLLMKLV
jgi:hypothetical protein